MPARSLTFMTPSLKNLFWKIVLSVLMLSWGVANAQDQYNAQNGQLTIPLVRAYGSIYRDVVIQVGNIISVDGGLISSSIDEYDSNLGVLKIPSVIALGKKYTNVSITIANVLSVGGRNPTVTWAQTNNSVKISSEQLGYFIGRGGFGAFNFFDKKNKSFILPSGREFWIPRLMTDQDFLTFSIDDFNNIFIDKNPFPEKYVAGVVDDILVGNFGRGSYSLIMIDQGRETKKWPLEQYENSYLWRLDRINGSWQVSEFGQELGRQFWHSSSNPIDINGDGILDFSVSNLNSSDNYKNILKSVLFTSSGGGEYKNLDLTKYLCKDPADQSIGSGSSALVKLANGKYSSISVPYLSNNWDKARYGTIMYLSDDGSNVNSSTCFDVRLTSFTSEMKSIEGYNSISVLDINGDGLDDFIIFAESNGSDTSIAKIKRLLVFVQSKDSTFRMANEELNLPFTYQLPNTDSDQFADWTGNEFIVTDIDGDKNPDLFMFTQLISHNAILRYGLRGGILNMRNRLENYSIPSSQIAWNAEQPSWNYRYIYPAEINNDGIVDFILIGTAWDSSLVSSANPYGQYFKISALLSQIK